MWEPIYRIERAVAGLNHHTFLHDDKTLDAVIHNVKAIGEAANRLPREFKDRYVGDSPLREGQP